MDEQREYSFGGNGDAGVARLFEEERVVVQAANAVLIAMEDLGVSQAELARRLRISRSRVSRALSGESNLTVRSLAGFAWALGTRLDDISLKGPEGRCAKVIPFEFRCESEGVDQRQEWSAMEVGHGG